MDLKPHQKAILEAAASSPLAAFFLPFGAGKTRIALERVRRRDKWPLLILCRPDDVKTWKDEMEAVGLAGKPHDIVTFGKLALPRHKPNRQLTEEQAARRLARLDRIDAVIDGLRPHSLIADQTETIKTHNAQITEGAIHLADRFRQSNPTNGNIAILTGLVTPQGRLEELWSQIRFLDGGAALGANYWRFLQRYAILASDASGRREILWTSERRQRVLETISHLAFFWDADALSADLPPVDRETVRLPPTPDEVGAHRTISEDFETPGGREINYQIGVVQALRQLAGGILDGRWSPNAKVRWIEQALHTHRFHRAVIFASFTEEIHRLAAHFDCPALTGEQPQKTREMLRDEFAAGYHRLLVCQVSLGKGMNELSAADAAIYTTPPWSNAMRQESIGRIVRPAGDKRTADRLKIFDLATLPIDYTIYRALARRQSVVAWLRSAGWRQFLKRKETPSVA